MRRSTRRKRRDADQEQLVLSDRYDLAAPPNLRVVQLLLGHTKIESTVRYFGIEVDDALAIAEQVDV